MTTKKIIGLILGLALIAVMTACGDKEEAAKESTENTQNVDVVATVNKAEITKSDFDEMLEQAYSSQGIDAETLNEEQQTGIQQQVVTQMVNNELLRQTAEKNDYTATEEEIDQQIKTLSEQFETEEEFDKALEENKITVEQLEEDFANDIMIQNYVTDHIGEIKVKEEEITAYYEQYSEQSEEGQEVPELEAIKPQIEQTLMQQKQNEEVAKLIEQLKGENEVEVLI